MFGSGRKATRVRWSVLCLAALVLTGCASEPARGGGANRHLTIGLAYIPNIQFAPFYVADALNYYREAGLDVTLRHHALAEDQFGALAAGREDVIYAGGDEMLQARTNSVPVVNVATLYGRYPISLIVPEDSPIRTPADLRGRSVGVPGPYGETYFGLLALLRSANLTTSDLTVTDIGFTQVAALTGKKVDGVMGYLNNEAVQFNQMGRAVRTINVADAVQPLPLVANGLGVSQRVLDARPDDIKTFISATFRAIEYAAGHAQEAFDISKRYVPGLENADQAAGARAVLDATIPLWRPGGGRMGFNDPETWRAMAEFMTAYGLISGPVDVTKAYRNDYLPEP
jgi:NitT/TauT family transport system substrate-binding protein